MFPRLDFRVPCAIMRGSPLVIKNHFSAPSTDIVVAVHMLHHFTARFGRMPVPMGPHLGQPARRISVGLRRSDRGLLGSSVPLVVDCNLVWEVGVPRPVVFENSFPVTNPLGAARACKEIRPGHVGMRYYFGHGSLSTRGAIMLVTRDRTDAGQAESGRARASSITTNARRTR